MTQGLLRGAAAARRARSTDGMSRLLFQGVRRVSQTSPNH